MGNAFRSDPHTQRINSYLNESQTQESTVVKLLLLGPGSTGKSTLFKSLQMVHSGGTLSMAEKRSNIRLIRLNILTAVYTLIRQCNILYQRDNEKYKDCQFIMNDNLNECIQFIVKHLSLDFFHDSPLNESQLIKLGKYIDLIWNLPCIQATYSHRRTNFAISDNLEHFFERVTISSIFNDKYMPTETDVIHNRSKTSGMKEYEYESDHKEAKRFRLLDVGGQRSERKKWVNYFDNVNGLLFVASLIDYNCVLHEDASMNGMAECLKVFEQIVHLSCFENCELILMLNKDDLLKQLLLKKDNGLLKCFSKDGDWPHKNENEYWNGKTDEKYWPFIEKMKNINEKNEYFDKYHAKVINFITKLFFNRHKPKEDGTKQQIHRHITVATENNIVRDVFQTIQYTIVAGNIEELGFAQITTPLISTPPKS